MIKSLILVLITLLLSPGLVAAQSCPTTCGAGQKLWVSTICQQKTIELGPQAANCCLYYCAASPDPSQTGLSVDTPIKDSIEVFPTTIKIDTPEGIATLITVFVQLFLGVAAIYSVYIAIRSALLLANADNSDAQSQAKQNLTNAVIGLVIIGTAIGLLQILTNILGLGSIANVFNAIAPVLRGGR